MLQWQLFYEFVPIMHVTAQEINYDVSYVWKPNTDMCLSEQYNT